ncbi:hypothetical protein B7P43_G17139 [Cryptotermes secundus]|uniref:SGNH hydrolase-type esterase domain-containing protein n=1 Tax=Cryptotermes secundus TaxID=105785 RepID=A0A2J7PTD9_9NEOP|nr:hypothetical protein B7P43_G17139 [Cryptotermes secundus]
MWQPRRLTTLWALTACYRNSFTFYTHLSPLIRVTSPAYIIQIYLLTVTNTVTTTKWSCDKCRTERIRVLEEELQSALHQIDELKARNRELEEQVQRAGAGKSDAVVTQKDTKCLVMGDSILRNVGAEHPDLMVECFPGIRAEQLHRVIEKRELGNPETLIIHVGTNDLRSTRNLDFLMGEVYALVTTAKSKCPNCRLVLSGVLRRRDVSWRRIGALNDRFEWIANALGITFVDPNIWIEERDFGRDGIHLNGSGRSRLEQLYARVGGLDSGGSTGLKE